LSLAPSKVEENIYTVSLRRTETDQISLLLSLLML
jgi:hypothetical protein